MKQVLDYGYIKFIEHWGSDERIIEAARMSTDKGFKGWGDQQPPCFKTDDLKEPCSKGVVGCPIDHSPGDEKLLAYLYEHKHHTPFEMSGMIIEVKAPIFVFREWHRHRTQCLAGATKITCVTPNGTTFKRTIKEIFDLKHGGVIDSAPKATSNGTSKAGTHVYRAARRKDEWRTRILPNCQERLLRVLDEETGLFTIANMASVWESGVKPIFKLTAGAYSVSASAEHPFFTRRGWVKMGDIRVGDEVARMGKVAAHDRPIPPALRQGIGVWTTMMRSRIIKKAAPCHVCGQTFEAVDLELDHVVPVSLDLKMALDTDNLKSACFPCHRKKTDNEQPSREGMSRRGIRWETVKALPSYVGDEMTYDLEVDGSHHNYCANDLVVHNSYNEMSARYVPLPDENYVPSVERLMQQGGANKQAQSAGAVLTHNEAELFRDSLASVYAAAQRAYEWGIARGVPKELARLPVPVARYSKMRAAANLRNWLAFLTLRMDPAAQWEIRQYANAVGDLIAEKFSRTWELFVRGKT